MSFVIVNGRIIETLDSDVFSPFHQGESPKKNVLFADQEGNIKFNIEELNADDDDGGKKVSILGKRKACDEFGGDYERYGRVIGEDYFVNNMGHGVDTSNILHEDASSEEKNNDLEDLLNWCYKYLNSKGININDK